jgi:hypothetical protein
MFKSQKIKFKEKSQILLVISICFLFLAILISKQLAKKEHTQAIVDKVQNKIHQKENELYHELEKLINFHQNNKKLAFYFFVEENQESNNSGIIYLIFEGDSLIYWSDNSVPLSDLISDSQTTIINSGNSWNLKVEKSNNDFRYIVLFTVKHQYSYQNRNRGKYQENIFALQILLGILKVQFQRLPIPFFSYMKEIRLFHFRYQEWNLLFFVS